MSSKLTNCVRGAEYRTICLDFGAGSTTPAQPGSHSLTATFLLYLSVISAFKWALKAGLAGCIDADIDNQIIQNAYSSINMKKYKRIRF